jgi:hypothetical protein
MFRNFKVLTLFIENKLLPIVKIQNGGKIQDGVVILVHRLGVV